MRRPPTLAMALKNDDWIARMARRHGMIEPFAARRIRRGKISYGLSSYGYDMRVADEFKVFTAVGGQIVDPKATTSAAFRDLKGREILIPPHSFALGRSLEYFRIPRGVLTLCVGKSTYARCGIIVNVTPFEPEWEGYATLAICNTGPLPAKIYAREGIAQIIFLEASEPCRVSYADKKGKYQAQRQITPARLQR